MVTKRKKMIRTERIVAPNGNTADVEGMEPSKGQKEYPHNFLEKSIECKEQFCWPSHAPLRYQGGDRGHWHQERDAPYNPNP